MATVRELRTQFTATAKSLKSTMREVKKEIKDIGPTTDKSVSEAGSSYKKLTKQTDNLKKAIEDSGNPDAFKDLNKAIQDSQDEFRETGQVGEKTMAALQSAINESGSEFDQLSSEGRQAISQIEKSVSGLDNDLKDLGKDTGLDELNEDVGELGDNLGEVGSDQNVGGLAAVGGALGSMKGGALAVVAGIAAVGVGIVSFIKQGGELTGALNNLQIQTGATDDELKDMEESLLNIYETGVGESFNDIASAMATVRSATKLTGEELEYATQNALMLRDSFDWEIEEQMRAVRGMMTNFNLSADESFTLLAQGRQEMGSAADDLLDTFNEYGHAFSDLGFNGEEAMNMIVNSMDAGVRNTDIAADSVNEFATRIMDGSDLTRESLQMAGLDADATIAKFKEGGPEAAEAFQEVTQAIGGIGDASLQEQTAVGLFGTMVEDAGVDAVLALGNVEGAADKTGDTLQEINDIKYSTIGEAFSGIFRLIQTNMLLPLQQKVMPVINTFVNGAKDGFRALFAIFEGDDLGGQVLLEKLGLTPGQAQMIINAINGIQVWLNRMRDKAVSGFQIMQDKIQEIWSALWPFLQPILTNIVSFVGNIVDQITSFWEDNGSQIMTAVGNAFNFVLGIIKFVMPAVLAIIKSVWGSIKNVINGVLNVIMGAVKIFTGLFTGDFSKMWEGVKQLFFGAIEAIWGFINLTFFGRIIKGAKTFILAFRSGFVSLWNAVKALFTGSISSVVSNLRTGWNVMWNATKTVFTNIWNFLKSTWKTISSLFTGTIKILRNIISTGWNFISKTTTTVFRGIWNFLRSIWNTVWNFINKIVLRVVSIFINGWSSVSATTRTVFSSIWNFLRNIWNTVYNFIRNTITNLYKRFKNGWDRIYNTTKSVFNSVWNFLRNTWNTIYSFIRNTIQNLFNRIRDTWNNTYNTTKNIFTNVWNFLRNTWSNIYNGVRDRVTSIFRKVRDTWNDLKSNTTRIFKDIYNGIKDRFNDIVDRAKELPKKIGDGIGKMKDKVAGGVTKVINKLAETLGKGVNGVINGINWVLDKIGVSESSYIDNWPVPEYAKGTKGHPGGLAIVGDGGQSELIQTPDGQTMLSPDKDTLVNLPKGSSVLSGEKTKKFLSSIPAYAKGIGDFLGNTWDGAKNVAGKAKDVTVAGAKAVGRGAKAGAQKVGEWAGNVWGYVKEPGKLLDIALRTLGVDTPKGGNFIGDIAKAGFSKVKDGAVDFIKDKMASFDFGGAPNIKGGASAWRPIIQQASARMGANSTEAEINGIIAQIQRESGGNQRIVQSPSVVDINTLSGNPARGLLQYIPQTFSAYKVPGHNNIYSGYDQLLAFFNNKNWRSDLPYGKSGWGPSGARIKGYADGGIVDMKQLAWIAEGGWAESIISHDPSKRARSQGIWEQTGQELGFIDSNSEIVELLKKIAASNGGFSPEIKNYFTPAESTPAQHTRKQQKMLRNLAMEWGL